MIVKNEAEQLADALENFHLFADEIIVVDTGSSDDTKEIALRHTDRVFDFEWCDDFSSARNHSLAQARGQYVLWMDADDRVEKEMAERIVKLREIFDGVAAFYFILQDMSASGPSCSFYQLRCVPRREDIRFSGRIHEQLTLPGTVPIAVDIVVQHHGYLHKGIHRGKLERNLGLLQKEWRDGRDDAFIHYYISLTSEDLGRLEEAREHMRQALERLAAHVRLMKNSAARQMNVRALMEAHFHLARMLRKSGEHRAALKHLTLAQALAGDDATSQFNLGVAHQVSGHPSQAIRSFESSLEAKPSLGLFPSAPLPPRKRILVHIAFNHLRLKQYSTAMERMQEAWRLGFSPAEAWEFLGFLAVNSSEWSIALRAYESASSCGELSDAGYFFLGHLYQQRGLDDKARRCYGLALQKHPGHVGARVALAKIHQKSGKLNAAAPYLESLLEDGIRNPEVLECCKVVGFDGKKRGTECDDEMKEYRIPFTGAKEKPSGQTDIRVLTR
jgi:glycosyltransferase involved in cell wall biosynthesis